MRIPHIIKRNVYLEYEASTQTKLLLKEKNRKLVAENFEWDCKLARSLSTLCIISISKHFEKYPRLMDDLVNCADRDHLLEILSTKLPLSIVVPLIQDDIYWFRRYMDSYGITSQRKHHDWTWKSLYLENYIRKLIEQAKPQYCDEYDLEEITILINPYVHRLNITELLNWMPPLTGEKEDIPLVYPCDHINFQPIFRCLTNITELAICFSMKHMEEPYTINKFKVSVEDCKRLDPALNYLKNLQFLKIHNSAIEDQHCEALMRGLLKNNTLVELNLSNCRIANRGALCIAKLMMNHPKLERLILTNNKIGKIGGEGLGYAMVQATCCPLKHLNMRLNPLGHDGVMGIFRCLVRVFTLTELIISGCEFTSETSLTLSHLLSLNKGLVVLDVSNNFIGNEGLTVFNGMINNKTLQWFDIRDTDINLDIKGKIQKILLRNRKRNAKKTEFGDDESITSSEINSDELGEN